MEGPSVVRIAQELSQFIGQRIIHVGGTTTVVNKTLFYHKTIQNITSWDKHLLIQFDTFTLRVHFLLFGTYSINKPRGIQVPQLSFTFEHAILYFYHCSLRLISPDITQLYDWRIDIMADQWDSNYVLELMLKHETAHICDVLLNQTICAGVGNIIKNEVLFLARIHPESRVSSLNTTMLRNIVKKVRSYAFEFYTWEKEHQLRKHLYVYQKHTCPRDATALTVKLTGNTKRKSYFCPVCQIYY